MVSTSTVAAVRVVGRVFYYLLGFGFWVAFDALCLYGFYGANVTVSLSRVPECVCLRRARAHDRDHDKLRKNRKKLRRIPISPVSSELAVQARGLSSVGSSAVVHISFSLSLLLYCASSIWAHLCSCWPLLDYSALSAWSWLFNSS